MIEDFENNFQGGGQPQVNYWSLLEGIHVPTLKKNMTLTFGTKEGQEEFKEWLSKHAPAMFEQYINALQQNKPEAVITSLNDFGMYCFVSMKYKMGKVIKAEDKPIQTTETQKEVEDKFQEDNVSSAVDDLFNELGFEVGDDDPESPTP